MKLLGVTLLLAAVVKGDGSLRNLKGMMASKGLSVTKMPKSSKCPKASKGPKSSKEASKSPSKDDVACGEDQDLPTSEIPIYMQYEWYLGSDWESCDDVCRGNSKRCHEECLQSINSEAAAKYVWEVALMKPPPERYRPEFNPAAYGIAPYYNNANWSPRMVWYNEGLLSTLSKCDAGWQEMRLCCCKDRK